MSDPRYIAILRCEFEAQDYGVAMLISEHVRTLAIRDLEDSDLCDVISLISQHDHEEPIGLLMHLRKARNILIRSRVRQCLDVAGQLDYVIWAMKNRISGDEEYIPQYNHGLFNGVVTEILERGGDPL